MSDLLGTPRVIGNELATEIRPDRVEILANELDLPPLQGARGAHVFSRAGIYGPGRNAIEALRAGTQRRIVKPGQIFSRIHVEDIAAALEASLARPSPGRVYNLADDLPCPPEDVVDEAARLLGIPPPPTEAFEGAALSPMARAFYADSKRVSNARLRTELGVTLRHPTYREGLAALVRGQARTSFS
ncbi:MAG: hypothetical protein ACO2ZK_08535 [Gemmobacter sp.]